MRSTRSDTQRRPLFVDDKVWGHGNLHDKGDGPYEKDGGVTSFTSE